MSTGEGPAPPSATSGSTGGSKPRSDSRPAVDPLRGSRTSGTWLAVIALLVVLALLAIFVLQNTQATEITFFGWTGEAPLAAALLIAAVAGLFIAAVAGALRIIQLRRRVKRDRH